MSDPITTPKKDSPVNKAVDFVYAAIGRLESTIGELTQRITPVLVPPSPTCQEENPDKAKPTEDKGQLGNQLTEIAAKINNNTDALQSLINRCTL